MASWRVGLEKRALFFSFLFLFFFVGKDSKAKKKLDSIATGFILAVN